MIETGWYCAQGDEQIKGGEEGIQKETQMRADPGLNPQPEKERYGKSGEIQTKYAV